jgi:endoglycosylceramidase
MRAAQILLALIPLACAPAATPTLRAEGGRLLDERGREVVLHGVNARIEGLFDVSFDDGRAPVEEVPVFDRASLRRAVHEVGFNALRVPINWSGLQPSAGFVPLDRAYLDELDRVLEDCAALEVWCLVDLHQDAYSKEIGEDGAPLWAIIPAPDELLEGPLLDLEARRTSSQVLEAFGTFFTGRHGVQDAYLDMLARLAAHLEGKPWVAGIEVFNEPVCDEELALQFAAAAERAIHEVDPDRLVLFEPSALRNLTDEARTFGGLRAPNSAYAPHLYPEVFSGRRDLWASQDPARLVESTRRARAEADEHEAPLIVTEYGNDPRVPHGIAWIERMGHEMDAARASRFFWLWEERSQDRWGLIDEDTEIRDAVADTLARGVPAAVEGEVIDFANDDQAFRLRLRGRGEHRLLAPARAFGEVVVAACDGREAAARRDGPFVAVRCGDGGVHELVLQRR